MEKTGIFPAGTSLALSLRELEMNKAALLLSLGKRHVSTNEYRLNRRNLSRDTRRPDLDHNSRSLKELYTAPEN